MHSGQQALLRTTASNCTLRSNVVILRDAIHFPDAACVNYAFFQGLHALTRRRRALLLGSAGPGLDGLLYWAKLAPSMIGPVPEVQPSSFAQEEYYGFRPQGAKLRLRVAMSPGNRLGARSGVRRPEGAKPDRNGERLVAAPVC